MLEMKNLRRVYGHLPPIISAQRLSKRYGAVALFRSISFTVSEGERIGIIGPNGSGKSTLLQILIGLVQQISEFAPSETVRSVIERALDEAKAPESERQARTAEIAGRAGLADLEASASALSGGRRKRLAVVEALVRKPDILLLDEPTNHLDLAGIAWLESVLQSAPFACVVVSHDRYFLEDVANEVVEISPAYENGSLRVAGNYSAFLEAKEEYLHAQKTRQEALENRVRTEIEWLRRGPKARTTKSKARIDKAQELIGELAEINARTRSASAAIDFSSSDRKTKQLLTLDDLGYSIEGRLLFDHLHFIITSGVRVGLVGPSGSGKTTFLRLLNGEIKPTEGRMRQAESLRVIYFDQNRALDPGLSLRRALAPESDSVIYRDQFIHVTGWAARFLFTGEQLNQQVGRLSGGERARVLIAQLMLQPADVLLLDEPTNDLDIPTLEILEESLLEFPGALVLVTHDRYMLDRVSTIVLGLDGDGASEVFADYSQWEVWKEESKNLKEQNKNEPPRTSSTERQSTGKKKLSYLEARDYATIEQRIAEAEAALAAKRAQFEDPTIASDATKLLAAQSELDAAQQSVDQL